MYKINSLAHLFRISDRELYYNTNEDIESYSKMWEWHRSQS